MSDKETQNRRLLRALRVNGDNGVSAMDALRYLGIYRCGARIFDLRQSGYEILMSRKSGQTAVYYLVDLHAKR